MYSTIWSATYLSSWLPKAIMKIMTSWALSLFASARALVPRLLCPSVIITTILRAFTSRLIAGRRTVRTSLRAFPMEVRPPRCLSSDKAVDNNAWAFCVMKRSNPNSRYASLLNDATATRVFFSPSLKLSVSFATNFVTKCHLRSPIEPEESKTKVISAVIERGWILFFCASSWLSNSVRGILED